MADISQYLQAIMTAVYGEDVRGSIHDAIEIINDVGEVVLSTGTAVTSASSSSTGFFEDSLYLNTDTYELWKCVGVDTWQSLGILKGDTGDPGEDGADGNRWFRGTAISGKAVNPTVYSGSGITDANPNDFYLNPSEGAIYHCVTGGDAATATWSYDFTMTGGGGGGSIVTWTQIQATGTKIATIDIDGSPTDVYAPTGGGGSYTASKGVKLVGSDIRADLKSDTAGSLSAASKGSTADREYAVGIDSNNNLSVNIPWTDTTYSSEAAASGGTALSLVTTGEKYDWNNKADASDLDGWTSSISLAQGDTTKTFTGLTPATYGYEVWINVADGEPTPTITDQTASGTSLTVTFSAITAAQAAGGVACIILRKVKL
jgi:hypothetical protein